LDQLKLIEEGMDAYIQRHYRNEDDQVWYRVRIGNFKSKEKASIVQKQIESITHAETWLDILPSGQK
jgi:cell division protein FtsN